MPKRRKSDRPGKARLFMPLILCSLLAASIVLILRLLQYMACEIVARNAPDAACIFEPHVLVTYLPMYILGLGAIATIVQLGIHNRAPTED